MNIRLNPAVTGIEESIAVALGNNVRKLKAEGKTIVNLLAGDPDFATPAPVVDAAEKAMRDGFTHYVDSRGDIELRKAAADKFETKNGLQYDPVSEILVTHGAIHGYYAALQALLTPGDEALVPDPSWVTHANLINLLKAKAVRVPAAPEEGFLPPVAALREALTERTKLVVINSPGNPTGAVASEAYLEKLAAFVRENDLMVISDEVYEHLLYDGARHFSPASFEGMKERTVVLNSFSKTFAMTGWRVGYLAAPAEVVDAIHKASQYSITSLSPFIQKAAAFTLTSEACWQAADEMLAEYTSRRRMVMDIAAGAKSRSVMVNPPRGAFYFFVDIRPSGLSSEEFCKRLLKEAGVAVVPGAAYGPMGEGFVRFTTAAAAATVKEGMTKILEWADILSTE